MEGMDQESRREDSTLDQTFRLQTVYFRLLVLRHIYHIRRSTIHVY